MLEIGLGDDDLSYVFIRLFEDAAAKIGKAKEKSIKSIGYDVENGLLITDNKNVVWQLDVNLKVKIPPEYKEQNMVTDETGCFCVECWAPMIKSTKGGTCEVCKYLKKA